jgi:hypothetical protein
MHYCFDLLQIVIAGPLKPLDPSGYGDSVKIIPYSDVIRLGGKSKHNFCPPKPEDIVCFN